MADVSVLAVDGGNSKTDVLLVAADGTVLARARGGGSCHQSVGMATTMSVIGELVARVAADAGLDPAAGPVAEHGAFYLAGADLPAETAALRDRIDAAGWARRVVVDNDTFALLRAGTDAADAVAVVVGAGVNAVGVAAGGAVARFPALGRLSGDWGGGADLGAETLWLAVRAEDGRGAPTTLHDAVAGYFGVTTVAEVVAGIHLGDIPADRLLGLTPVLLRVAGEGDPVAVAVVRRMAEEVVLLATAALGRLGLLQREADVVLGGGVLAARDPLLLGSVEAGVADRAPSASVRVVDTAPVLGAALLGLDAAGAPPGAGELLRSGLGTLSPRHTTTGAS